MAEYFVVAESVHQRGQPHPGVAGDSVRPIPPWLASPLDSRDGVGGANCAKGS
jgi:hypothetical protein